MKHKPAPDLSRTLADMALVLMGMIKCEFKAGAGKKTPTLSQFKMLYVIKDGVRHVGRLSETFGISQPATSKMVDSLVKDGLLKRVPHPTDRRQIELHLTKKASSSMNAIYSRALLKVDKCLASLSSSRQAALAREMSRIIGLLSKTK